MLVNRKFLGIVVFGALGLAAIGVVGYGPDGNGEPAGSTDFAQRLSGGIGEDGLASPNPVSGPGRGDSETSAKTGGSQESIPGLPPDAAESSSDSGLANGGVGQLVANSDRKIIQTASLDLEVEKVGQSFEEVGRIATSVGGFVSSSNFSFQGDNQFASMTIRVPATRYQNVLSQLRGLGIKVVSESSQANDVTEEFSDLNASLRNLEATESQLLLLLGRTENISEVLQVQDRLNSVRGAIEQVQGRIQLINGLSELATISVHLSPILVVATTDRTSGTDLGSEIGEAWDSSIEFLTDVAAGFLRVVVFAWWVPIVGVPGFLIAARLLRSRPQPREAID